MGAGISAVSQSALVLDAPGTADIMKVLLCALIVGLLCSATGEMSLSLLEAAFQLDTYS